MRGLSRAVTERLLKATAKPTEDHSTGLVAKDGETTWAHVKWGPITVLEGQEGPGGRVKTAQARACVANGILPGLSATDGIGDAVSVSFQNEMVDCVIVDVVTPSEAGFGGEDDGDMLGLILRRA